MAKKDAVGDDSGKKSTNSSSSPENNVSSRSVSPNMPGAYQDKSTRADHDDNSNSRNHASPSGQQTNVGVTSKRTDQPRHNGSEIGNTTRGATSSSPPSTRTRTEVTITQIYGTPIVNGRGQDRSLYSGVTLPELSQFASNVRISAHIDSNKTAAHPSLSSDYRNNFVTPRPNANGRSSDQSSPFSAVGGTSSPVTKRKDYLRQMASDTLAAVEAGSYDFHGTAIKIGEAVVDSIAQTQFYGPDTPQLVQWPTSRRPVDINATGAMGIRTHVSVLNISTLAGARLLENVYQHVPGAGTGSNSNPNKCFTGVLNFASATKPGGGFLNGAEAQEESLARASTLYASLKASEQSQKFYNLHAEESRENLLAYYSHAIIYSPRVLVIRDDEDGSWFQHPFPVDVLSCAAVNAGEVRRSAGGGGPRSGRTANVQLEVDIEKEMTERMARILRVFEFQGVRNIVLGTFGTGVFQNKVDVVARIWAHLLIRPDARFKDVFERVIFAITGRDTFVEFQNAFAAWGTERAAGHGRTTTPASRGSTATANLIDFDES